MDETDEISIYSVLESLSLEDRFESSSNDDLEIPRTENGEIDEKKMKAIFEDYLFDLSLSKEETDTLMSLYQTYESQYRFCNELFHYQKIIPSPEFFVRLLSDNLEYIYEYGQTTSAILEALSYQLRNNPFSWAVRFYGSNGINIILCLFSKYVGSINHYYNCTLEDSRIVYNCLSCIRYISDTEIGLNFLINDSSVIPLLVGSITHLSSENIDHIFYILMQMFGHAEDRKYKLVKQFLKCMKTLRSKYHGWKNISSILQHHASYSTTKVILSFYRFMLSRVFKNSFPSLRIQFVFDLMSGDCIDSLSNVPYLSLAKEVELVRSMFEEEKKFIKSAFNKDLVNPYNYKSVTSALISASLPSQCIPSVLLQLLDIYCQNQILFKIITTFFHNLLTSIRVEHYNGNEVVIKDLIEKTINLKSAIKIPREESDKHDSLYSDALYVNGESIKGQDLEKLFSEATVERRLSEFYIANPDNGSDEPSENSNFNKLGKVLSSGDTQNNVLPIANDMKVSLPSSDSKHSITPELSSLPNINALPSQLISSHKPLFESNDSTVNTDISEEGRRFVVDDHDVKHDNSSLSTNVHHSSPGELANEGPTTDSSCVSSLNGVPPPPPPPPPPPLCSNQLSKTTPISTNEKLSSQPIVSKTSPYRQILWERVFNCDEEKTVWSEPIEHISVDKKIIQDLFTRKQNNIAIAKQANLVSKLRIKEMSIARRSNIEMVVKKLNQHKIDMKLLSEMVRTMNIKDDIIQLILNSYPTDQEIKAIKYTIGLLKNTVRRTSVFASRLAMLDKNIKLDQITNDSHADDKQDENNLARKISNLDISERYLYDISNIRLLFETAQFINIRNSIDGMLDKVATSIGGLEEAFISIMNSKKLRELFKFILAIGNTINTDQAYGFNTSKVENYLIISTTTSGYNLGNYIYDNFDINALKSEISTVINTKYTSNEYEEMEKILSDVKSSLYKVGTLIDNAKKSYHEDVIALDTAFNNLLEQKKPRIEELSNKMKNVKDLYNQVISFYSLNDFQEFEPQSLFNYFDMLVNCIKQSTKSKKIKKPSYNKEFEHSYKPVRNLERAQSTPD